MKRFRPYPIATGMVINSRHEIVSDPNHYAIQGPGGRIILEREGLTRDQAEVISWELEAAWEGGAEEGVEG